MTPAGIHGGRGGKRALVLVGGGITGAMYEFGCLRAFDDFFAGELSSLDFDCYIGTSAGAVVGMLLANGVSPASVMDIIATSQKHPLNFRAEDIFRFDWENFRRSLRRTLGMMPAVYRYYRRHRTPFSLQSLLGLLQENLPSGLFSMRDYIRYLDSLMRQMDLSPSFRGLKKELYIPAISLDRPMRTVFGDEGSRDVPISRAIAASSALPFYFEPVSIDGVDYVDGGTAQLAHVDIAINQGADRILVLNPIVPIQNDQSRVCIPSFSGGCVRIAEKGISYVWDQAARINSHEKLEMILARLKVSHPWAKIVLVEPGGTDTVLFAQHILSYASRVQILDYGYRSTRAFLRERGAEMRELFLRPAVPSPVETSLG
ncbi:MAG TPA: patatin-like phospholipase family protein [Candidatus Polarisedimenticolia bacterium]|nr:patatin-like phospholipase family protein [Candidatus Polarisedimenticolia bacterium]